MRNTENLTLTYTIYCHIHIDSGRRYVGLTSQTMEKRWKNHLHVAKSSKGGRWHFPNAIRKYGKDAFSHEILETCDTLEAANAAEEKWIEFYKTRDPQFGFNITKGGEHIPHPYRNPWDRPEYREKSSLASKAKWQDPSFRAKVTSSIKEVWEDPDYQQLMLAISSEINSRPEVREKISASLQGKEFSPEHRAKISEVVRARVDDPNSSDSRAARSAAAKKRWANPEYRKRQLAAHVGKTISAEQRAKSALRVNLLIQKCEIKSEPVCLNILLRDNLS